MGQCKRMCFVFAAVAVALTACKKDQQVTEREGPVRIAFGDCAGPTARFESGPRPQPFDAKALETKMEALLADLDARRAQVAALEKEASSFTASAAPSPQAKTAHSEDEEEEEELMAAHNEAGAREEQSGGTGTAMALSEGKMGKADSARATGQYAMKGRGADPQLAKRQAIEAARNAGVLGTLKAQQGGAFASLTGTGDFSSGLDDADVYGGLLGDDVGSMQGGFGVGGGGTGWGTIGTGRYGTIGHGSGTGSGYGAGSGRGGMRGRKQSPPSVRIGDATAIGDLDKNIIRRYIRRKLPRIKYCYEKELLVKPGLAGTVTSQFQIAPTGSVLNSRAEGVDKNVASCVADTIKTIQFPKPKGGGLVQVRYPFTFRIAEDGSSQDKSGADKSAADKSAAEPPADDPPPPKPPEPAKPSAGAPTPVPANPEREDEYRPGADNPLANHVEEIEACLRRAKDDYGVLLVELKLGDDGAVSGAESVGLSDTSTARCIEEVAREVAFTAPVFPVYRCPIAFGDMPTDAAPALDITTEEVRFADQQLASTPSVVADESPQWKIPAVFERLSLQRRLDKLGVALQPIAITGPRIIRPVDEAPMKVVSRVLKSAIASGSGDWVMAAQKPGGWRLLHPGPQHLPVAPVPVETGAGWWSQRSVTRSVGLVEELPVRLSILVTEKEIWTGLSRINEFRQIPKAGDTHDWTALAEVLAEFKGAPYFKGRRDLEIAAEDRVQYIEVVRVIDAAIAAGFTDWGLAEPASLSARPQL